MKLSSEYQSARVPNILKAASRDKSRPVLTCVYLDVDRAELQATDSYCLASVPVEVEEGDVSGLIAPEAIAALRELGGAMDEASFEKVLDARIWRRLSEDRAYIHAANAEEQSAREREIELEEYDRLVAQLSRD